jgi:Aldose 1-epimerase
MQMQSRLFGRLPDGTAVQAFSLRSSVGLSATITQYGARIAELLVPVAGGARNVTLGFDRLEPYLSDDVHLAPSLAATPIALAGDGSPSTGAGTNFRSTTAATRCMAARAASLIWYGRPSQTARRCG